MLQLLRDQVNDGSLSVSDAYKLCLIGDNSVNTLDELESINKVNLDFSRSRDFEEQKSPSMPSNAT